MLRRLAARRARVSSEDRSRRLDELRSDGWVLPRALGSGAPAAWTLVGTVDSSWSTAVDPCGLVTPFGPGSAWSLDWWIGADDRWHLPSTDTGVRQHLVGNAPVVETLVRIPGGDAVQRVYGMRGEAFAGGDEWVVVEVENRSSVPFAIAFAVRPATPEGLTSVTSIGMVPVGGGQGRDVAHAVDVDGRTGLLFSRRPARLAASTAATGDVAAIVRSGDASELPGTEGWSGGICPDGLAQAAFVFPVAHTTTIRVVLPIAAEPGATLRWPGAIPPFAHVAAGWDAHSGRSTRIEVPDPQLAEAVAAARRALLLAPWSDGLRHAGPPRARPAPAQTLADTGRMVATLDRLGHHDEVARTLRHWPEMLASSDDGPGVDVAVVEAVATHRLLAGDRVLFDDLLPDIVASVVRLDRAASQGRLDPPDRRAAVRSLASLALALEAAGQTEGACDVRAAEDRVASARGAESDGTLDTPRARLIEAITAGQMVGVDLLDQVLAGRSPTFALQSPGEPQDLVAAALLVDAVCALLVQARPDGLSLLVVFPRKWYGNPVELHEAPTVHGRLSYAVRWHGTRPALLWELERTPNAPPVRIMAPGLDPAWTTTQARGEALLAEVAPPTGLEPRRIVVEHPGDGGTFV